MSPREVATDRMKVVVTGAGGQLGRELVLWPPSDRYEVVGLTRHELDITSEASCRKVFASLQPDVVIHCAAYTAVDQAESDEVGAMTVNALGSGYVAEAAKATGAKLIYISTDYVFDGNGTRPYQVDDPVNPQTIYGKSKLAGETISVERNEQTFVVRTSWVYGRHGANFVKTMLKLGQDRDSLKVVSDQKGSPTYTKDLAAFLLELAQTDAYGVYHASNSGSCTWYEFAKAIFEESGMTTAVVPCTSDEFVRPAPRPRYSVMDLSRIRKEGLSELPAWREALKAFLREEQE